VGCIRGFCAGPSRGRSNQANPLELQIQGHGTACAPQGGLTGLARWPCDWVRRRIVATVAMDGSQGLPLRGSGTGPLHGARALDRGLCLAGGSDPAAGEEDS